MKKSISEKSISRLKSKNFSEMIGNTNRFSYLTVSIFLILHGIFFIFQKNYLDSSFFLAPDEEGYLGVFKSIISSEKSNEYWGFPPHTSYQELHIIYLPASILQASGIEALSALRIQSILLGSLSYLAIIRTLNLSQTNRKKLIALSILIPTFFVWQSLALRESFIYFAITSFFLGMKTICESRHISGYLTLFFSLYLLSIVKDYLFILLFFSTLLALILKMFAWKKIFLKLSDAGLLLIFIVVILVNVGLADGIRNSLGSTVIGNNIASSVLNGNSTNGSLNANTTSERFNLLISKNESGSLLKRIAELIIEENVEPSASSSTNTAQEPSASSSTSTAQEPSASSSTNTAQEPSASSSTSNGSMNSSVQKGNTKNRLSLKAARWNNVTEVLIAFSQILLRPTPFMDNGSKLLNLLSFETIFWAWLILYSLLTGVRNIAKGRINLVCCIAFFFVVSYLYVMSISEINVGTMVRHRSVLLFPLIILLSVNPAQNLLSVWRFKWLGTGSNRRPHDFQSHARTN